MNEVIIISSFHKIHGKCNPDELYKIIEKIQPEIIFEELSNETFNFVYSNGYNPKTIEAITIKNYLRSFPIRHFPVDTFPISEKDLFNGADEIANKKKEYLELWNKQLSLNQFKLFPQNLEIVGQKHWHSSLSFDVKNYCQFFTIISLWKP